MEARKGEPAAPNSHAVDEDACGDPTSEVRVVDDSRPGPGPDLPYWLYHTGGSRAMLSYTCEICGCGASYQGYGAYQRHFLEARHDQAMHQLGIPNTTHFHLINTIADARRGDHDGEDDEEGGRMMIAKATYNDLRRQGLI